MILLQVALLAIAAYSLAVAISLAVIAGKREPVRYERYYGNAHPQRKY